MGKSRCCSTLLAAGGANICNVVRRELTVPLRVERGACACCCCLLNLSFSRDVPQLSLVNKTVHDEPAAIISGALFTMILFRGLGGRFTSTLPSDARRMGAFAHEQEAWAMSTGTQYASSAERVTIRKIGKAFGCHTCGTRQPSRFIADHQPPNKWAKRENKWRNKVSISYPSFRSSSLCSVRSVASHLLLASLVCALLQYPWLGPLPQKYYAQCTQCGTHLYASLSLALYLSFPHSRRAYLPLN